MYHNHTWEVKNLFYFKINIEDPTPSPTTLQNFWMWNVQQPTHFRLQNSSCEMMNVWEQFFFFSSWAPTAKFLS